MPDNVTKIIERCNQDDRRLILELAQLAEQQGHTVYREALLHLVGKEYDIETARRHWDEALAHRERMLAGDRIDSILRPALLDYLHQVVRELEDPRIVEAYDLANIRNASVTDGLTGLHNQTYFKSFLEKLCSERRSENAPGFAVLLLDLDHFKQYNDRCGHLPGDRALRQVAKILLHCIRKGDIAARYGGEEFAILLRHVSQDQAYSVAERIRKVIDKADFRGQHLLDRQNLTVSGGLAFATGTNEQAEPLIQRADEELYRAKLFRNVISPHYSELRRTNRVQRKSIVEYALVGEQSYSPAMSHDISPFGIALDCDRKLDTGTPLKLRFRHPYWPSNRQVLASIRHVDERQQGGLYRVGVKFNPEQALSQTDSVLPESA